jgi:hypothetical protein
LGLGSGLDLYIFSQSPGGYQVQKFGRQMEILLANFFWEKYKKHYMGT